MASDLDVCTNYPDFAVICSFIENFSEKLKLSLPNIEELQLLLENTENVNPNLAQLVAQLLRKINKSVKYDKWERGLQRFAHTYSHQDGWELERFGFKKAKLEVKIRVIKNLLEAQFDGYKSFKEKVNLVSAKELRLQPCGRDKHGVSYWCQLDEFASLRIYRDDQDEETWKLVARSREELVELIDELEKKFPSSIGRETSVDESESGITTPMVLSEAPTPVDSKAATPVTSGRTSPVLDTGQVKDKLNEPEPVVQVKLPAPEGTIKKENAEKKGKQSKEGESSETKYNTCPETSAVNIKDIHETDNSEKPKEENSNKNEKSDTKTDIRAEVKSIESVATDIHKGIELRSVKKKTESPEFRKKASNLDAIINMSVSKSVGGKLEAKVAAIKELPPPNLRKEKLFKKNENTVEKTSEQIPSKENKDTLQETTHKEISVKELSTKIPKEPDKIIRIEEEKRKRDDEVDIEHVSKKTKLDTSDESQTTSQIKIAEKMLKSEAKSVSTSKPHQSIKEEGTKKSEKKVPEVVQSGGSKITSSNLPPEQISLINTNKREHQAIKPESLQRISKGLEVHKLSDACNEENGEKAPKTIEVTNKELKLPPSKVPSNTSGINKIGIKVEKNVNKISDKVKIKDTISGTIEAEKDVNKMSDEVKIKNKINRTIEVENDNKVGIKVQSDISKVDIEVKSDKNKIGIEHVATSRFSSKELKTQNNDTEMKVKEDSVCKATSKDSSADISPPTISSLGAESNSESSKLEDQKSFSNENVKDGQAIPITNKSNASTSSNNSGNLMKQVSYKESHTEMEISKPKATSTETVIIKSDSVLKKEESSVEDKQPQINKEIPIDYSVSKILSTKVSSNEDVAISKDKKLVKEAKPLEKNVFKEDAKFPKFSNSERASDYSLIKSVKLNKNNKEDVNVDSVMQNKNVDSVIRNKNVDSAIQDVVKHSEHTKSSFQISELLVPKNMPEKIEGKSSVKQTKPSLESKVESLHSKQVSELLVLKNKSKKNGEKSSSVEEKKIPLEGKVENLHSKQVSELFVPKNISEKTEKKSSVQETKISLKDKGESLHENVSGLKKFQSKEVCKEDDSLEASKISEFKENLPDDTEYSDSTTSLKITVLKCKNKSTEEPTKDSSSDLSSHTSDYLQSKLPEKSNDPIEKKEIHTEVKKLEESSKKAILEIPEIKTKEATTVKEKSTKSNTLAMPEDNKGSDGIKESLSLKKSSSEISPVLELAKGSNQQGQDVSDNEDKKVLTKSNSVVESPLLKKSESHVAAESSKKLIEIVPSATKDDVDKFTLVSKKGNENSAPEVKKGDSESKDNFHQKIAPEDSSTSIKIPVKEQSSSHIETNHSKENVTTEPSPAKIDVQNNSKSLSNELKEELVRKDVLNKSETQKLNSKDVLNKSERQKLDSKDLYESEEYLSEPSIEKGSDISNTKEDKLQINIKEQSSDTKASISKQLNCQSEQLESNLEHSSISNLKESVDESFSKNDDERVDFCKESINLNTKESVSKQPNCQNDQQSGLQDSSVSNLKESVKESSSSKSSDEKLDSCKESISLEKNISKSNSEPPVENQKSVTQERKPASDCTTTSQTETVSSAATCKDEKCDDSCTKSESYTQEQVASESDVSTKDSLTYKEEKEPDVGETIEDPVLIVKGDGEGKLCDAGNLGEGEGESCEAERNLTYNSGIKYCSCRNSFCNNDSSSCSFNSITQLQNDVPHYCTTRRSDDGAGRFSKEHIPWWENFELYENYPSVNCDDVKDIVVEEIKYFCGDGEGAECEAGNSGDDEEVNCNESSKVKNSQASLKKNKASEESGGDVLEGEMNGLKSEEVKSLHNKEKSTIVSDIKHVPDAVSSETHNNEQKTSENREVNGKVEDSDKKEETIAVPPTKKGRGRPKKGTWKKITVAAEAPVKSEEVEKEEEIEEQEKTKGRKTRSEPVRNIPEAPRLRSARIAKIREREETERRELEAQRLKQIAEENKIRDLKKKARTERRYIREIKKNRKEKKKDKEKKRKKRKKRAKKKKGSNVPWAHSSTSSSSSSEEDDLDIEEDHEDLFKSDHEFSPESDIGEEDATPIKRARTAKKVLDAKPKKEKKDKKEEEEEEEEQEDDTSCMKCNHQDHPETILLCDSCDQGWHLSCLRPPLLSVPEGDWICPTCEHSRLIEKLKSILEEYDNLKKRAQNEEMRRQRLAYISVSLDNVIPEKKRKKKHRRGAEDGEEEGDSEEGSDESDDDDDDDDDSESGSDDSSSSGSSSSCNSDSSGPLYTLRARPSRTPKEQMENFDELINEAIRDEMEAAMVVKKGLGRGKDIANIVEGEVEDDYGMEEEQEPEEEEEEEELPEIKPSKLPEQLIEEASKEVTEEETDVKTCVDEGKTEDEPEKQEAEKDTEEKMEKEEETEDVKEEDEKVNKKKRKKNSGIEDNDEDVALSEEAEDDSESEVERRPRRANRRRAAAPKKKRRLTDLDVEEDEDDSDEDFLGSSEDDDEEEISDALVSSSFETESESDDSDYGGRRGKGNKTLPPLRRSARNRRNASIDDYDSDFERRISKKSKKKKARKHYDSSEDEEFSSDSDSYVRKKKAKTRRKSTQKSKGKKGKGKKGSKKGGNKKGPKKKPKSDDEEEAPPKPKRRVKYAKPPKPKEEEEDENSRRRVTRGRQINYYDSLLMSDDEEEEEIKPKSRGKVMKGERAPSESSDYEESADERKKRRGVSGGLGRGKVMKSEEEDEEEEYNRKKKKLESEEKVENTVKKDEDSIKVSPPVSMDVTPSSQNPEPTPKINIDTSSGPTDLIKEVIPQEKKSLEPIQVTTPIQQSQTTPVVQQSPLQQLISRNPVSVEPVVPNKISSPRLATEIASRLPLTVTRLNTPISGASPSTRPSFNPRGGAPNGPRSTLPAVSSVSVIGGPSSSISITPVSFGSPRPPVLGSKGAPPASISVHSVSSAAALKTASEKPVEVPPAITISTKRGSISGGSTGSGVGTGAGNNAGAGSPGPLPPVGKWSPHVIGSSNSGSATPPRPGITPVNSSPPPPYRSSPIPATVSGASTPLSTVAHRGTPPNLPPQTTSTPTPYSPYQSPEHFGSHPAFPSGFHPGSSHSPGPHGNQPRHSLPPNHPMYGTPVTHPNYHQGLSPHHTSVLRGPPHDIYRHSSPSSVGSPSHVAAAHARSVLLKQAYAGLEPLPYGGSPPGAPIDATRHNSPGPPINEAKEDHHQQQHLSSKRPVEGGEFSSGLMSYFSSQRDENVD